MNKNTTDEKLSHSEQNARAVAENIIEMVASLDRKTAAEFFVKDWDFAKCVELLKADDEEFSADEAETTVEDLREQIADKINEEVLDGDGFEFDQDEAEQRIHEDPLFG